MTVPYHADVIGSTRHLGAAQELNDRMHEIFRQGTLVSS